MSESSKAIPVSITEDEAALYDRQIRLWGLEAQQRMRNATILVIRLRGLAAEAIKNIVLAGIGELLIVDPESVTEEDLGAGFLFRDDDVGKKRVDAARPHIEALNPLVKIRTYADDDVLSESQMDQLLSGVDLVCMTDSFRQEMIKVNEACRRKDIKFYAGGCYGLSGFIFCDLLVHHHIAPDRSVSAAPGAQPKMVKYTTSYAPLSEALNHSWKTFTKRQTKDFNPAPLFAIMALWEYKQRHPDVTIGSGLGQGQFSDSNTVDELELIANQLISTAQVNPAVLQTIPRATIEQLAQTAVYEFSPVCAVLGGLLAQDLLKALAGREPPYANMLVFDGSSGNGNVARLAM